MGKWAPLMNWYHRQKRVLPWRDDPTLYRVWVSEIMLQQTQVATVVPYFERFLARFPTEKDLAQASEEDVMLHWAGLGYYSRARNLQKAAKEVVARGGFPRTREEWLELPGIGPYTAGAIVSIALNQAEPILDGNVERVLSRLHRVADPGAGKRELWNLAALGVRDAEAEGHAPRDFNQALMELGATVCAPKNPICEICPLKLRCGAGVGGDWASYPPRRKPKEWKRIRETVYCVADFSGRVLLRKRSKGEWRAGLWDLPDRLPEVGGISEVGALRSRYIVTNHKIERTTRIYSCEASFEEFCDHWKWGVAEPSPVDESQGREERYLAVDLRSTPIPVAVGSPLRKTLPAILKWLGA